MSKLAPDASSIERLVEAMDRFDLEPDYQRQSGLWSLEKRQLFVDSLINGYDVPKLYFHHLQSRGKSGGARYAIVDGKQRLETVRAFRNGDFELSVDFMDSASETYDDSAAGMTFRDLSRKHPDLATRFSRALLDVVVIETDEQEVIEELFSRLNEAVPLNAPEKRNALRGAMPGIIRELVRQHTFFKVCLPIENSRYRQYDLAAKFLYLAKSEGFVATKRKDLDNFVKRYRNERGKPIEVADARRLASKVRRVLDMMSKVFIERDELLSSVGLVTVYFMTFLLNADTSRRLERISRDRLLEFDALRRHNRSLLRAQQSAIASGEAPRSVKSVRQDLAVFDRLMQSPNDGQALEFRYRILDAFLHNSQFREKLPKSLASKLARDEAVAG